jgi:hypothetical protein
MLCWYTDTCGVKCLGQRLVHHGAPLAETGKYTEIVKLYTLLNQKAYIAETGRSFYLPVSYHFLKDLSIGWLG